MPTTKSSKSKLDTNRSKVETSATGTRKFSSLNWLRPVVVVGLEGMKAGVRVTGTTAKDVQPIPLMGKGVLVNNPDGEPEATKVRLRALQDLKGKSGCA